MGLTLKLFCSLIIFGQVSNLFSTASPTSFHQSVARNTSVGKKLGISSNSKHGTYIIGGTDSRIDEFPWQVSIQENQFGSSEPSCGGAILNQRTIISAAHCFNGLQAKDVTVVAGIHNVFNPDGTEQRIGVSKILRHPSFDPTNLNNDIAVLTLSNPLNYGPRVNAIPIAQIGSEPTGSCVAVGWGYHEADEYGGQYPDALQKVQLGIVERRKCEALMQEINPITTGMICANTPGKGTCNGDSGSGFVCRNAGGSYYLAGVVSWGVDEPYCVYYPEFPSVFTNIAHYASWIQSSLQ